jgi:hypothetical protein
MNKRVVNNNPKVVRLTEDKLRRVVAECVENVRKQMIRESEEDADIWARWEQEYYEAQRNFPRPYWGFELANAETGEWQKGTIKYDRDTHTLNWNEYSIDVDPTFSVDANIDALLDYILNGGKYITK